MKVSSINSVWYKRFVSVFFISLLGFFVANLSLASWTPPSNDPPSGNTLEPIDISNRPQSKQGKLGINKYPPVYELDVTGQINATTGVCIDGSCVSTLDPMWSTVNTSPGDIFNSTLGKVGIGVSAPVANLDIITANGGVTGDDDVLLRVSTNDAHDITKPIFSVQGNGITRVEQLHINGGYPGYSTEGWRQYQDGTSGNYDLAYIYDKNGTMAESNVLTVSPSDGTNLLPGYVGIGNNDPQAKLQVSNALKSEGGNYDGGVIALSPGNSLDGEEFQSSGFIKFLSKDNTSSDFWSGIEGYRNGNSDQTELYFYTETIGDSYPSPKMMINGDGQVGIGKDNLSIDPSSLFDVAGNASFDGSIYAGSSITTDGTVNAIDVVTDTVTASGDILSTDGAVTAKNFCMGTDCISAWPSSTNYWTQGANSIYHSGVTEIAEGVAPDTERYGTFGITKPASLSNSSYIGLTRNGSYPLGIGINSADSLIIGQAYDGKLISYPAFVLTKNAGATTGNVGIGDVSPTTKLSIKDDASGPLISLKGAITNYRGISVRDTSNNEKWFYGANNSNDFVIRQLGTTDALTVNYSNGNVGIGATAPGASGSLGWAKYLDVQGTPGQNAYIRALGGAGSTIAGLIIGNNDGGATNYGSFTFNNGTNKFRVGQDYSAGSLDLAAGSRAMDMTILATNGNVGIGTTTPGYKLSVAGDINLTGNLLVNGSPLSTSQWLTTGSDIYYPTGKVGIGSLLDANDKLTIYDSTYPTIKLTNNSYISELALATGNGFYSNIANAGDLVMRSTESNIVLAARSSSGSIKFATQGGASESVKMVIANGGNVGIGNNDPGTYKLNVTGDTYLNGVTTHKDRSVWNQQGDYLHMGYEDGIWSGYIGLNTYHDGTKWVQATDGYSGGYGSAFVMNNNFNFTTNDPSDDGVGQGVTPVSRLYINGSSGSVGIGTNNPLSLNGRDVVLSVGNAGNGSMPGIVLKSASDYNNNGGWEMLLSANSGGTNKFNINNGTNSRFTIDNFGNVGIGEISPGNKLTLTDASSGPIIGLKGLTNKYRGITIYNTASPALEQWFYGANESNAFVVRSTSAGVGTDRLTIDSSGTLTVNKLNATQVDPPYKINNKGYSTYGLSMIGSKEEYSAIVTLQKKSKEYLAVIDFNNQAEDSDLWLFSKVTNLFKVFDKLIVQLTANFSGKVWYEKDEANNKLIIHAVPDGEKIKKILEVSLRLTAPRYDHEKWLNTSEPSSITNDLDEFYKNEK